MTLEELFRGRSLDLEAAQERLTAMMAEQGLPYSERTHTYNSRLAQELAKWAELQPVGAVIHDALFQAYFVDGINLARVDKLVQIAGSVGLLEEEAHEVLESRSFAPAVEGDWRRSTDLGVTGVPTFVIEGRGVVGAQPYETLEQLVTQSGAHRRP
jgi:predicted DsbA family dithiol-disulfide isomerase